MLSFILVAALFLGLFIVIELFSRLLQLQHETTRKLAHVSAGSVAAGLPLLLTKPQIIGLALLFTAVMIISKRRRLFTSIHDIGRRTYGEFVFPAGIALTALLSPDWRIYTFGILTMAFGDALASLIGQKYGRHRYKLGLADKTFEGSAALFLTALVIGLAINGLSPDSRMLATISAAGAATLVEAITPLGFDNLTVPVVAAYVLAIFS